MGARTAAPGCYEPMLPEPSPIATIVVCEDDTPTLELLCDNLRADAYDTLAAPTAADALRPLEQALFGPIPIVVA